MALNLNQSSYWQPYSKRKANSDFYKINGKIVYAQVSRSGFTSDLIISMEVQEKKSDDNFMYHEDMVGLYESQEILSFGTTGSSFEIECKIGSIETTIDRAGCDIAEFLLLEI